MRLCQSITTHKSLQIKRLLRHKRQPLSTLSIIILLACVQLSSTGCAALRALGMVGRLGSRAAIGGEIAASARLGAAARMGAGGSGLAASRALGTGRLGIADAGLLAESRIAAVGARSGLAGVLEELISVRPLLRGATGEIVVAGRPILIARGSFITLPSSGQSLGLIRGTRIFAVDDFGVVGAEIGEFVSGGRALTGMTPLRILRVRPNWYRVMIDSANVSSEAAILGLAGIAAHEQENKRKAMQAEIRDQARLLVETIKSFRQETRRP